LNEANSRFRLTVVGFVVFAMFSALFARLWFLQVGDSKSYAAQTERNRIRLVREPAIRGSIVDANGNVLVQNTLVDTITVKRGLTPEEQAVTVKNLANVLAETPEAIPGRAREPEVLDLRAGPDRAASNAADAHVHPRASRAVPGRVGRAAERP